MSVATALLPSEAVHVVVAQTLKGGALPLRMDSIEGEPVTASPPAQPGGLLILAGLVVLIALAPLVLTSIRGVRWRAVVIGIVVLLATLASAAPATAAPRKWELYQRFVSIGHCREVGQDLVWSEKFAAYRCIPYLNSRRVDLQVSKT
jgi:hypothetical protein